MATYNPKTDGNEHLIDPDEEQAEDETAVRVIEVANFKYTIQSTDPYGLWHIKPTKGPLPADLVGQFTGPQEAENAIQAYASSRGQAAANTLEYKEKQAALKEKKYQAQVERNAS